MDVLQSMSIFIRVVEAGSFSAVARETRMSQPTISKHIAALEQRLNVKLLRRTTRQLTLTDVGKQYYERCSRILDEISETEASIRDQQSNLKGMLRINLPITYGRLEILPRLWGFLDLYPELKVEVLMDDHYQDLVREGVDVAIRIGPLSDSNLIAKKIGESPRLAVASPNYISKKGKPTTVADLERHHCIIYTLMTTGNKWQFHTPNGLESVAVTGRFSTNSPDAIREALLNGMGIANTPHWLVDDCIRDGSLVQVLEGCIPTSLDINAIYPERLFVPIKVRSFIQYLEQAVK